MRRASRGLAVLWLVHRASRKESVPAEKHDESAGPSDCKRAACGLATAGRQERVERLRGEKERRAHPQLGSVVDERPRDWEAEHGEWLAAVPELLLVLKSSLH